MIVNGNVAWCPVIRRPLSVNFNVPILLSHDKLLCSFCVYWLHSNRRHYPKSCVRNEQYSASFSDPFESPKISSASDRQQWVRSLCQIVQSSILRQFSKISCILWFACLLYVSVRFVLCLARHLMVSKLFFIK